MAKVLTGFELGVIAIRICAGEAHSGNSESTIRQMEFQGKLAKLITETIGGELTSTELGLDDLGIISTIRVDARTIPFQSIWCNYDPDVQWRDGKEIQP